MADIARAALPLVGFFFFGPVGALVGGLLADVLFPLPGVKGPRLNELNVQHSTVGAPVPLVYGTAALAGNVIWSSGLIETKHEDEQGGFLGVGGQEITTYTYSVDVAIGIAEGPISGIRRIWADADLIYDASSDSDMLARLLSGDPSRSGKRSKNSWQPSQKSLAGIRAMSAQLNFELYLGTEDQLPDPTIEADEGVGNTPAYRGLAYIVFNDFQLEKYGNRIPNFRFEVYSGTPTECGLYSAGNLQQWSYTGEDVRNALNNHDYAYTEGGHGFGTLTAAIGDMESDEGRPFLIGEVAGLGDSLYVHGWSNTVTPNTLRPCDDPGPASTDTVIKYLNLNSLHVSSPRLCTGETSITAPVCAAAMGGGEGIVQHLAVGQSSGMYVRLPNPGDPEQGYFEGLSKDDSACAANVAVLYDHHLTVRRNLLPPSPCIVGTQLVSAPGYCVVDGQITQGVTWTEVAGTFHVLQEYDDTGPAGEVTAYPVDPCLRNDHPDYNNQAFWEAANAAAEAAGDVAPGRVYGVDYPETQSFAYFSECDTVDTECVPMALIVADICRRAGLRTDTSAQIDVSDLTTCVQGYIIGRQMSARDALGPLRMFGLWDACESQGLLKFVERGHALVDSLTEDDLGAHEAGAQAPPAMEVSRVQEKELPRRVRLHFANFLHDHEASEQSASRSGDRGGRRARCRVADLDGPGHGEAARRDHALRSVRQP